MNMLNMVNQYTKQGKNAFRVYVCFFFCFFIFFFCLSLPLRSSCRPCLAPNCKKKQDQETRSRGGGRGEEEGGQRVWPPSFYLLCTSPLLRR
ncbi:hypothetical protein LY78DRAFT_135205 [Colletotrichum sublineola]|nr:hypothetical protein LY78DRAFT_135205 [Colletotrichum sublineola]